MGGAPEREVAARAQEVEGSLVAHRRVDQCHAVAAKSRSNRWPRGGCQVSKAPQMNLHIRQCLLVAPGDRHQVWADLDAGDQETAPGKGNGCLAGGASHFQEAITCPDPSLLDKSVVERFGVLRPSLLLQLGRGVEGRAQTLPVRCHHDHHCPPVPTWLAALSVTGPGG